MRKVIRNFVLGTALSLMAALPIKATLPVQAAGNGITCTIPSEYMPKVDVFTIESVSSESLPQANEYTNMIIAQVTDYVNVRQEPDTESGIVGRLYSNAVAKIIKYSPVDDSWLEIQSGEVTGYVKAEFFLIGQEAQTAIETLIQDGEELTYARSMNDILAEIAAREEERRQKAREEAAAKAAAEAAAKAANANAVQATDSAQTDGNTQIEDSTQIGSAGDSAASAEGSTSQTSDTAALRQKIVDFALQYLGGPYVHGGNSLTKGTDCSGFTKLIFAEFGYSLNRTPSGQLSSDGRSINYSEIQPGDIICYTSNGKTCTHVALYIGDGLIVHAANSKKGIITNEATYSTILGVKNIID